MKNTPNELVGGKNENLTFLSALLSKHFQVPRHYAVISLEDYERVVDELNPNKFYAVRSSGTSEDSKENSMAGQFKTHLNVPKENIREAIRDVQAHSESKTWEKIPVVIQEMVVNISYSGVAFSHDVDNNRAYTVIQLCGGSWENIVWWKVTGETYNLMNDIPEEKIEQYIPEILQKVYRAIQELRKKYCTPYFDIEFALNGRWDLFILQIRPLTTITERPLQASKLAYRYASRITHRLSSRNEVLGDMIDINPRELVWGEPKFIQGLFQYLFADSAIPQTRKEIGYKVIEGQKMTTTILNNTYVFLQTDLRAFLPEDIPEADEEKFYSYYKKLLEVNPDDQSRLDSELYPVTRERAAEIIQEIYTDTSEQTRVMRYFSHLFNRLERFLEQRFETFSTLEEEFLRLLGVESYFEMIQIERLSEESIEWIIWLAVRVAKEFAFYARWAFYYSQFEISDPDRFSQILYQQDIYRNLTERGQDFIRFRQIRGFNLLETFDTKFSKRERPVTWNPIRKTNNKVELFLAARENLKFILMRILFFLGEKIRKQYGEEIWNEEFYNFLWKKDIRVRQHKMRDRINLILPGVLSAESNPLCHKVNNGGWYFIGKGILEGEIIYIENISRELDWNYENIAGKILLIDHATPEIDGALGYVRGVITKVGGPLAHIVIRAREMEIPSVVWVGTKFDTLKRGQKVRIEFNNRRIHAI